MKPKGVQYSGNAWWSGYSRFPDGSQVISTPDGARVYVGPDGRRRVLNPPDRRRPRLRDLLMAPLISDGSFTKAVRGHRTQEVLSR